MRTFICNSNNMASMDIILQTINNISINIITCYNLIINLNYTYDKFNYNKDLIYLDKSGDIHKITDSTISSNTDSAIDIIS